mgnify:CR=1 FL=1
MQPLFVRGEWDAAAKVWVATSDDVPGWVTEAATVEALIEKLETLIPELLDANGHPESSLPASYPPSPAYLAKRERRIGAPMAGRQYGVVAPSLTPDSYNLACLGLLLLQRCSSLSHPG